MKTVTIQANKIKGQTNYKLSALSNEEIEHAIFVEINENDIKDIVEMMNE